MLTLFLVLFASAAFASSVASEPPLRYGWTLYCTGCDYRGAEQAIGSMSLDRCMLECERNPRCQAIDFRDNQCFLNFDMPNGYVPSSYTAYLAPPKLRIGWSLYCSRCDARGPEHSVGVMSLDDCMATCETDPQCQVVDYGRQTGECFINEGVASGWMPNPEYDAFLAPKKAYRLGWTALCSSCDYRGQEQFVGTMTLHDCMLECERRSLCKAIDYGKNSRPQACFLDFESPHGTDFSVDFDAFLAPPKVEECYRTATKGAEYRGFASRTVSGRTCQSWSEQTPHSHFFSPDFDSSLEGNFCRNPDGSASPWCYTTDATVRWELCPIPICPGDCVRPGTRGEDYRGYVATTKSGRQCQRWDEQLPHEHNYYPANYQPQDLRENYCRNPDNSFGPWCFTTDPAVRWEECNVPLCQS